MCLVGGPKSVKTHCSLEVLEARLLAMTIEKRHLAPGSIIDLFAPGFVFDPVALKASCELIESWGFIPRVPKGLLGRDLLCASPLSTRRDHLLTALKAKDSAALWAVRGGYGSLQLLPHLPKKPPRGVKSKWILGYSDVTSLHHFFLDHWGWQGVHAPLFETLSTQKIRAVDLRSLKALLQGRLGQMEIKGLRPANVKAEKSSRVSGTLMGGNLTVIQSSMGTPFQCIGKGRVVFFEEVGERGYRVDRALTQLTLSGFFKGVKAVIAGDILGGAEKSGRTLGIRAFRAWAKEQQFPVFTHLPVGHGLRQAPLVVGSRAVLSPQKNLWSLSYSVERHER